jgi:hypothetical protein
MQLIVKSLLSGVLLGGAVLGLMPIAQAGQLAPDSTLLESELSVKWVPLARINQAKPVTIELHNKTAEPLEYLITTHTDFRTIAPGETVTIQVTDFPSFVNINAKRSVGLKYGLKVNGNKISVDLNLTGGQGDTTLNIHDLGAVYLY